MRFVKLSLFLVGIFWLISHGSVVYGQALRFQPQGASATGQGNAFAAQADDPSAIHYNPAGLTQLDGVQMVAGTVLMGGSFKHKSPSGADTRGDFGGSVAMPSPSHAYLSVNLGALGFDSLSKLTIGIGVNASYGSNTRYPVNGPFNTATTFATLPLLDIKPTLAYKVTEDLFIGLGADIYTFAGFLGEGQAEQHQVGAGVYGIPAGSSVELSGKGTGAGMNASLLYQPIKNEAGKPLASIGVVYRSRMLLPLQGTLLVNGATVANGQTGLVLPPVYTVAAAVWPVRTNQREWKLEVDVDYVGWKANKDMNVYLSNGQTIPQPRQWQSVYVVAVGTEYKWIDPEWLAKWDVAVRAGYTRTENPVPDLTFNPGTLSLSSNTLSLGAGFFCKSGGQFVGLIPCGGTSALWPKGIGVDVAYQEWFYEPHRVTGNQNPTVNGTYHAFVHLGIVSVKLLF